MDYRPAADTMSEATSPTDTSSTSDFSYPSKIANITMIIFQAEMLQTLKMLKLREISTMVPTMEGTTTVTETPIASVARLPTTNIF